MAEEARKITLLDRMAVKDNQRAAVRLRMLMEQVRSPELLEVSTASTVTSIRIDN